MFIIGIILGCGEGKINRPFSPINNIPEEFIIAIEDQFIMYLDASGCETRPSKNSWDPPEDPRHLVTFYFRENLTMAKGVRGEIIGKEIRQREEIDKVNDCIDQAIVFSKDMIFPTAPQKMSLTLQFPLVSKK